MSRWIVVVALFACGGSSSMSKDDATEKYAKKLEPQVTAMIAAAKVAEAKRNDAQPTTPPPAGIDVAYDEKAKQPSSNAVLVQAEDLEALDRNGNPIGRFMELYLDDVRTAKALLGADVDFKNPDWRTRRDQIENVLGAKYVFVVQMTTWREPKTSGLDGTYSPGSASARVSLVEVATGAWHGNVDVAATNSDQIMVVQHDTNEDTYAASEKVVNDLRSQLGRAVAEAIQKRWKAEVPYTWGYLL